MEESQDVVKKWLEDENLAAACSDDPETALSAPKDRPTDIEDLENESEVGSSGSSVDSDTSQHDSQLTAQLKVQLWQCLSKLDVTGSFASFGACPDAVNPGIFVHGLGGIGLPLSERDALALSDISHPAPFGKGSKTIVDTTFRNTKELNADQYTLKNAKWGVMLKTIENKVVTELGVPTGRKIKAVPYKMLLYGKGAMFKRHRDSEKVPKMFGTLVICLPSQHVGGEVHVTHNKGEKILKTAEASEYDYSYLCWYADVEHEIREVTAGYRLVLTYNLVFTDYGPNKLAAHIGNEKMELDQTLALWRTSYDSGRRGCPRMLAWIFEHLYTRGTLSHDALKGNDRLRGEYMIESCGKYGLTFWLASLEYGVEGECAEQYGDPEDAWRELYFAKEEEPDIHYIDDVHDTWLKLLVVVDQQGIAITCDVPFEERRIVQKDPFGHDPDFEEWSGPTGNEGVTSTHYYRRTVALLMPKEQEIVFLYERHKALKEGMSSWVLQLIEMSRPSGKKAAEELTNLCERLIEDTIEWRRQNPYFKLEKTVFNDELLGTVMKAGIHLNDVGLCQKALKATKDGLPEPQTVEAIQCFGLPQMRPSLIQATRKIKSIPRRLEFINGLYSGWKEVIPDAAILEWIREESVQAFMNGEFGHRYYESREHRYQKNTKTIIEVGVRYGDYFMTQTILPCIMCNLPKCSGTDRTNLALGFLTHVFEAWTTGRIAETTIKVVFPSILDEFILGFTIDDPNSSKPERISCLYSAVTPLYPSEVVNLFRRNASLGFWDYTNKILDKLQEKACNTVDPAKPFATFHLPFAKALYENPDLLPESSPKHDFIKFILTSYRDHFFQPRLTLPADWAREKGGCGCEDCERLDSFLVDPASVEIWIPAAEDRIDHLSRILPRLYGVPACETQTSERDSVPGFLVRKKDYQWRRLVLDWEEDQKAAGETLEKNFDQTKLKDILGDGYRKFFGPSMEWSPLPGE